MAASAQLPLGTVVGNRYRLDRQLGEGGFGAVYAATRADDGVQVALKVLSDDALERVGGEGRFRREAELARRLDHPNIVRVLDEGVDERGVRFIAFELLRGRSLGDELTRWGAMQPRRAAQVAVAVLDALEQAHRHGIVHRDLKPANIFLLDGSDAVKVLDFGIAKSTNAGTMAGLTQAGQVLGTPAYMAVEQLTGANVAASTDIFALGVVLAQMLLGRIPYPNESTAMDIVRERLTGQPLSIPPDMQRSPLGAIIARASAPEPHQRFQSATEMRGAIEAALLSPSFSNSLMTFSGTGLDAYGPTGSSVPGVVVPQRPSSHPYPSGYTAPPGSSMGMPHAAGAYGSAPPAYPPPPAYSAPPAQQPFAPQPAPQRGVGAGAIAAMALFVAILACVGVGLGVWMRSNADARTAKDDSSERSKKKSKKKAVEEEDEEEDDEEDEGDAPGDKPQPPPPPVPSTREAITPPPPPLPVAPPAPTVTTRVIACSGAARETQSSLTAHLRAIGWSTTGVLQYCAGDMVNFVCSGGGGTGVTATSGSNEGSAVSLRFGSAGDASAFATRSRGEAGAVTLGTDGAHVLRLEMPEADADKMVARICK
jgi:serine/threonine protein kinase